MAVAYKADAITAFWARRVVTTRYASILNNMADEFVIPEFIQEDCTAETLTDGGACVADRMKMRVSCKCRGSIGCYRSFSWMEHLQPELLQIRSFNGWTTRSDFPTDYPREGGGPAKKNDGRSPTSFAWAGFPPSTGMNGVICKIGFFSSPCRRHLRLDASGPVLSGHQRLRAACSFHRVWPKLPTLATRPWR